MSDDFKAAFRAAQAQRGLAAKTSKQQLKAMKAKQNPAGSVAAAPKQVHFQTAPAAKAGSASGLPADFFDSSKGSQGPRQQQAGTAAAQTLPQQQQQQQQQQQKPQTQPITGVKRPAAVVAAAGGSEAQANTAVPKGFFDSKADDEAARGIQKPTKQDREAAFAEFAASMDDQLKEQAVEEEQEAIDAALEREEREAFEVKMRMERAAQLKALKSNPNAVTSLEVDADIAAAVPSASRKRRVVDVLQEVLGTPNSDSENEEDDEDTDALLDWRAKAV